MTAHYINEATFKLPCELKDKTVHMFVTADDGPNEFNVVVTRADIEVFETLDSFVNRLTVELKESLPAFVLGHISERSLGNLPALEIAYSWNNGGIAMHQRQVITPVSNVSTATTQAIMIAATCRKPFSDHWNKVFDDLLDSVQLRHPASNFEEERDDGIDGLRTTDAALPLTVPGETLRYVFALAVPERILHVFQDEDEACRSVNAIEVEDGLWKFFDANGTALQAVFIEPNTGKIWRTAGRYALRGKLTPDAASLDSCLNQVQGVRGGVPLNSLDLIRIHLAQSGNEAVLASRPDEA